MFESFFGIPGLGAFVIEAISGQDYLEKPLALYTPKTAGWEAKITERLARWQALKTQIGLGNSSGTAKKA